VAIVALFAILASVVSTGILILFSWNNQTAIELTPEQNKELQQLIDSGNLTTLTWSDTSLTGETIDINITEE
jgi:hypothetical protein